MIYLEDYLDTVESLPQELTRNFTQMRELDVSAQASIAEIGAQTQEFIAGVHSMSQKERQAALIKLSSTFQSSLKHGSEKVALATLTYGTPASPHLNSPADMVDQHVRRLDDDLEKYERELAAATRDASTAKPARKTTSGTPTTRTNTAAVGRPKRARPAREEILQDFARTESPPGTPGRRPRGGRTASPAPGRRVGRRPRGSDAIIDAPANTTTTSTAAAASAGNADAPEMGDDAGSGAAEDIMDNKRDNDNDSAQPDAADEDDTAMADVHADAEPDDVQEEEEEEDDGAGQGMLVFLTFSRRARVIDVSGANDMVGLDGAGVRARVSELSGVPATLPVDPNEPTYCVCQQVSYGEMIGCDNEECEIEWFHYQCVGLDGPPKGKWYCPSCSKSFGAGVTTRRGSSRI